MGMGSFPRHSLDPGGPLYDESVPTMTASLLSGDFTKIRTNDLAKAMANMEYEDLSRRESGRIVREMFPDSRLNSGEIKLGEYILGVLRTDTNSSSLACFYF